MSAVAEITFEQISNAVDRMSKEQRGFLFSQLIGRLEQERENDADELPMLSGKALDAELRNRIQDAKEHPELGIPWEQARRELLEDRDA
jgi:hypothetical protein